MASIQINEDENLEKALKRFKQLVEKEGIITEYRKRQYFIKPSAQKHEKIKTIKRRELRNLRKSLKMRSY